MKNYACLTDFASVNWQLAMRATTKRLLTHSKSQVHEFALRVVLRSWKIAIAVTKMFFSSKTRRVVAVRMTIIAIVVVVATIVSALFSSRLHRLFHSLFLLLGAFLNIFLCKNWLLKVSIQLMRDRCRDFDHYVAFRALFEIDFSCVYVWIDKPAERL